MDKILATLLKSVGVTPEKFAALVEDLKKFTASVEERQERIEQSLFRIEVKLGTVGPTDSADWIAACAQVGGMDLSGARPIAATPPYDGMLATYTDENLKQQRKLAERARTGDF